MNVLLKHTEPIKIGMDKVNTINTRKKLQILREQYNNKEAFLDLLMCDYQ